MWKRAATRARAQTKHLNRHEKLEVLEYSSRIILQITFFLDGFKGNRSETTRFKSSLISSGQTAAHPCAARVKSPPHADLRADAWKARSPRSVCPLQENNLQKAALPQEVPLRAEKLPLPSQHPQAPSFKTSKSKKHTRSQSLQMCRLQYGHTLFWLIHKLKASRKV